MPTYEWVMKITVEENSEEAAQSRIEEALEEAFLDPDGVFPHGEMTEL